MRERIFIRKFQLLFFIGLPSGLNEEDLAFNLNRAREAYQEENSRTRAGFNSSTDPAGPSVAHNSLSSNLSDQDVASLRKKFKFLEDFSDQFIRSTPYDALLRTETTAIKISDHEKNKAVSVRLSSNRDSLASTFSVVQTGKDNRWDQLHEARFLPGAGCLASKLWLRARVVIGDTKHVPISTYDMNSIGLGGYVSKRGWVELHDVGSDNLSLKLFNINSCGNKVSASSSNTSEGDFKEILELGEFKLAIRAAREALSFVHPWNKSMSAIEGFLLQTNFCNSDLQGIDKPAVILTQFVDYIFGENADRWRGHEPFLSTGLLKAAWDSFFGAKPASSLQRSKNPNQQQNNQSIKPGQARPGQKPVFFNNYFDDLCRMYNIGRCAKPVGTCFTRNGVPLKHICNFRADPTKPAIFCGKDHPCSLNH